MSSKESRPSSSSMPQREPVAPRKRFRIARLEERIAPSKGGKGTRNCGSSANLSVGSSGSIY